MTYVPREGYPPLYPPSEIGHPKEEAVTAGADEVKARLMAKQAAAEKLAVQDPWVHRSEGMRCKTCIWFVPKQPNNKLGYDLGRCRRHAPTMGGYPVVFVNDWCGDHRLDENRV